MRNKQANLAVHHTIRIRACTRTYIIQGRAREKNFDAKLNAICKKEISRNSGLHALLTGFFNLPLDENQKYSNLTNGKEFRFEGYGNDMVLSEDQVLDWTDRLYLKVEPEEDRKLDLWPTCLR